MNRVRARGKAAREPPNLYFNIKNGFCEFNVYRVLRCRNGRNKQKVFD